MAVADCLNDDDFGPVVKGCRNGFDFTVKFELIIFSLVPNSIFVLVALLRCLLLSKRRRIVEAQLFLAAKLIVLVAFTSLQLSRLVFLIVANSDDNVPVLLASSALCFLASMLTIPLSYLEHDKTQRPSTVLSIYLFVTLLLDTARARTLWLTISSHTMGTNAKIFTATLAFKAVILLLESKQKTTWLRWDPEKHSPEESSGFFNLGLFTWLKRLFMSGYSSVLTMDSLYCLDEDLSSEKMYDRLCDCFDKNISSGSRFRLAKALGKALLGPLLLPVLPRLILVGFTFSQPFFLAAVLKTIARESDEGTRRDGFGLIGAAVVIYTGIALSRAFYGYFAQRSLAMIRGCLVSSVYEKTTRSQILAGDDAAAVTLMSTDIERVTDGLKSMHDVWADILQVGLGCWLLQRKLGFAFLAPVIVVLCCSGVMVWLSRAAAKTQASWMPKIQSRVGTTSKVITQIKQIKISGIAQPIEKLIQALRVDELSMGNRYRMVLVITSTTSFAPRSMSAVLSFALGGRDLDVSTMYESLSYLVILTAPLSGFFQRIPAILSAFTCLERIQRYLEKTPRQDFRVISKRYGEGRLSPFSSLSSHVHTPDALELRQMSSSRNSISASETALSINNGRFAWTAGQDVLNHINITIPVSQLTFVIGPVASGKSSLCKAILGDIPIAAGEVKLHPAFSSVAFCDQVPFLISGTVRENIIGHVAFDQARFSEVIWAAALTEDIASLPNGHDTNLGTNGTSLSGGQKARVSLARALYDRSPLLVLDDVFSGLDNSTATKVFFRTFGPSGLLRRRGTTALVCTHSTRHIPLADHIIALGPQGTIVEQGPYESLTQDRHAMKAIDFESTQSGAVADELEDVPQTLVVYRPQTDDAITKALDDRSRQLGDWKVYKHYFNSMNKLYFLLMLAGCILIACGQQFPTVWVGYWATDSLNKSTGFYIGIYALFSFFILSGIFLAGWTCFIPMTIDVGRELHRKALWTVMHAPLRLFTATDTGTITNLFSQDTTIIDSELSMYLLNFVANVVGIIVSGFVIALASPFLAASYPVLIVIGYCVQMFYLRTSRQLRLLDLEAKSPLYTHFLDTIKGSTTIRAFGWVADEVAHNRELLDTSQRPAYLLAMIQHCLMLVLNILVAFLAVGLVSLATQLRTSTGFTGASLVTLMSFSDAATQVIICYTALETSIGAVSRLKTFSDKVPPEYRPGEDYQPPKEWPKSGSMVLQNVSASHSTTIAPQSGEAVLALKDISLTMRAGEKIAVCGRTGSGKSSLILFLLRLLDPISNPDLVFTLDDIDMFTVDRTALRSHIIAVPQECVFLPDGSSIRSNIDPTGTISDTECVHVLEMVQLSAFVTAQGGIDAPMSGEQLSGGQQQLFSLGRAIYCRRARFQASGHDGGLLLLDEISSSVDHATEALMHDIISEEFAAYAIVAVAHRLELMVDFVDRVVVLDKGSIVEEGAPRDLLKVDDGKFRRLYQAGH